ncbi:TPA: hypothetical protein DCW54_00395 [Candidatus Dependentiae bacterium]|nr:hypothetical protein [Candidatus Dependentiae bacterium]
MKIFNNALTLFLVFVGTNLTPMQPVETRQASWMPKLQPLWGHMSQSVKSCKPVFTQTATQLAATSLPWKEIGVFGVSAALTYFWPWTHATAKKTIYQPIIAPLTKYCKTKLYTSPPTTETVPIQVKAYSAFWYLHQNVKNNVYRPILSPYVVRFKAASVSWQEITWWRIGSLAVSYKEWIKAALNAKNPIDWFTSGLKNTMVQTAAETKGVEIYKRFFVPETKETRLVPLSDEEFDEFDTKKTQQQEDFLKQEFSDLQNTILYGPPGMGKTTLLRAYAKKHKEVMLIRFPTELFDEFDKWYSQPYTFFQTAQVNEKMDLIINQLLEKAKKYCDKDDRNRVIFFVEEADAVRVSKLLETVTKSDIQEALKLQSSEESTTVYSEDFTNAILQLMETFAHHLPENARDLKESLNGIVTRTRAKQKEINENPELSLTQKIKEEEQKIANFIIKISERVCKEPAEKLIKELKRDWRKIGYTLTCQAEELWNFTTIEEYLANLPILQNILIQRILPLEKIESVIKMVEETANLNIEDKKLLLDLFKKRKQELAEKIGQIKGFITAQTIWKNIYQNNLAHVLERWVILLAKSPAIAAKSQDIYDLVKAWVFGEEASTQTRTRETPIENIEQIIKLLYGPITISIKELSAWRLKNKIFGLINQELTAQKETKVSDFKKNIVNSPIPFVKTLHLTNQIIKVLNELTPELSFISPTIRMCKKLLSGFNDPAETISPNLLSVLEKTRVIMTTNHLNALDPLFLNNNAYGDAFEKIEIGNPRANDIFKTLKEHLSVDMDKETIYEFAQKFEDAECDFREITWAVNTALQHCPSRGTLEQCIQIIRDAHTAIKTRKFDRSYTLSSLIEKFAKKKQNLLPTH